jgi:hypothetical protein
MLTDNKCTHNIKTFCSRCEFEIFRDIVNAMLDFQSKYIFQGSISEAEQIAKDCKWTDILTKIVEYGNKHVLSSYEYRIEMED